MKNKPVFTVRVVHINGPRKGEIDKTSKELLLVGRHPDSDILFPTSERTISRRHAQIIRTGSQFRLLNQSQNGCFVNGKYAHSTLLNNGDVIMFAKDGPKVSFLYSENLSTNHPSVEAAPDKTPVTNRKWPSLSFDEEQKAGFTVQFGPKIFSYNKHQIKIGRHINNDIVIEHAAMDSQHAAIRYQLNNYFLCAIYQKNRLSLNDRLVTGYTRLLKDDVIMFGINGPQIRYMGNGRFIEVNDYTGKLKSIEQLQPPPVQFSIFRQNNANNDVLYP